MLFFLFVLLHSITAFDVLNYVTPQIQVIKGSPYFAVTASIGYDVLAMGSSIYSPSSVFMAYFGLDCQLTITNQFTRQVIWSTNNSFSSTYATYGQCSLRFYSQGYFVIYNLNLYPVFQAGYRIMDGAMFHFLVVSDLGALQILSSNADPTTVQDFNQYRSQNCSVKWSSMMNVPFTNHGGPIVQGPYNVHVWYDNVWSGTSLPQNVRILLTGLPGSDYFKVLNEYTNQVEIASITESYDSVAYPCSTEWETSDSHACLGGDIVVLVSGDPRPSSCDSCAYHNYAMCGNRSVRLLYLSNMQTDAACSMMSYIDPSRRILLDPDASMLNMLTHELAEAITNPTGGNWYDDYAPGASSMEIADVCQFVYGPSQATTLSSGVKMNLQSIYSYTKQACFTSGATAMQGTLYVLGGLWFGLGV